MKKWSCSWALGHLSGPCRGHAPLRNTLVPEVRITAGWSRAFLEPPNISIIDHDIFCYKGYAERSGQCAATTSQTQWGIQSTYMVLVFLRWKHSKKNNPYLKILKKNIFQSNLEVIQAMPTMPFQNGESPNLFVWKLARAVSLFCSLDKPEIFCIDFGNRCFCIVALP